MTLGQVRPYGHGICQWMFQVRWHRLRGSSGHWTCVWTWTSRRSPRKAKPFWPSDGWNRKTKRWTKKKDLFFIDDDLIWFVQFSKWSVGVFQVSKGRWNCQTFLLLILDHLGYPKSEKPKAGPGFASPEAFVEGLWKAQQVDTPSSQLSGNNTQILHKK